MNISNKYKNKIYIIIFIGILVLFSFRLLYLDADVPNWGITHYMPIDEGSYSLMALNKYDFGTVDPSYLFDGNAPYVAPQLRNNLIGNVCTYISLRIFGDNYYGLRLPSVLYALIVFSGTIWILNLIRRKYTGNVTSKENKFYIFILLLLSLLLVCDFDLLVSSRVCENSLLRSSFVVLSIIVCCVFDGKSIFKKYFLLTFLATISVFLVYITNAFLGLAIGLSVLVECFVYKKKSFLKAFGGCITGGITALLLSEIYYFFVWDSFALKNMFQTIKAFQTSNLLNYYETTNTLYSLFNRTVSFISSDIILYNLPICFLVILTGFIIIKKIYTLKNTPLTYNLLILIAFYIQTLFAEDMIIKKFLVVYPCLLILLYFGIISIKDYSKAVDQLTKSKKVIMQGWCLIFGLLCLGVTYKIYSFRRYGLVDDTTLDFEENDFIVLFYIVIAIVFIFIMFTIIHFFDRQDKWKKICLSSLIILAIGCNAHFSYKYVFKSPTYSEKQVMIDLGDIVGNDYVIGEYANGYRLYNNVKSIPLSSYGNIKKFIEAHPDYWYFDYYFPKESLEVYFNNVPLKNSKYTGKPYKVFKRKYRNYGDQRPVCLYKIVKKNNNNILNISENTI